MESPVGSVATALKVGLVLCVGRLPGKLRNHGVFFRRGESDVLVCLVPAGILRSNGQRMAAGCHVRGSERIGQSDLLSSS